MSKKISEKVENEIFEELKAGKLSYSKIAKKYGVGKGTITRIKNRKDKNLEIDNSDKHTLTIQHRRKLREAAIRKDIVKKSPIVVAGLINVLQGIEYSVTNLIEINEESRETTEKIVEELEKLNENVDKYIHNIDVNSNGKDVGKEQLIKTIYKAAADAGNFYARETIRIKAISELRSQIETFVKYEGLFKEFTNTREFIDNLFKAMNVLSDEQYKIYRDRIVELYEPARDYFELYETEVE